MEASFSSIPTLHKIVAEKERNGQVVTILNLRNLLCRRLNTGQVTTQLLIAILHCFEHVLELRTSGPGPVFKRKGLVDVAPSFNMLDKHSVP